MVRGPRLEDLKINVARRVFVNGTDVAVVRLPGDIVTAIGDACAHKDKSLSQGDIEDLGAEGNPISLAVVAFIHFFELAR